MSFMLPPKFNHLGHSKKRTKRPTKALTQATKEHSAFLEKMGLNPNANRKRIKLTGAVPQQNAAHNPRQPDLPDVSNNLSGWAPKIRIGDKSRFVDNE